MVRLQYEIYFIWRERIKIMYVDVYIIYGCNQTV